MGVNAAVIPLEVKINMHSNFGVRMICSHISGHGKGNDYDYGCTLMILHIA